MNNQSLISFVDSYPGAAVIFRLKDNKIVRANNNAIGFLGEGSYIDYKQIITSCECPLTKANLEYCSYVNDIFIAKFLPLFASESFAGECYSTARLPILIDDIRHALLLIHKRHENGFFFNTIQ
ncbi:hypothetical protein [Vibrio metoecus]|uniref:hypothetical protein n=1 Tax=Vibrio metoecus TaxID=1481663 RepID=UPI000511A432|nr:hypothetical protein [Vibrio metoecus]